MFIFGALAPLFGSFGLTRPEILLSTLGFDVPDRAVRRNDINDQEKNIMRSEWIEYNGKRIFYQDFSRSFFNSKAVKAELEEVQKIVKAEPKDSVLVLTDLRDTNISSDLIPAMNAASAATKDHVRKTAVLGVIGVKRKLGDLLTALTGQPLQYFDDMEAAKKWLTED